MAKKKTATPAAKTSAAKPVAKAPAPCTDGSVQQPGHVDGSVQQSGHVDGSVSA